MRRFSFSPIAFFPQRSPRFCLSVLGASVLALSPSVTKAESKNPADYPLRIHIFRRNETTFYSHHQADEAKGEGRANLFEGGEAKGIDFQFDCSEKLRTSSGFETFPAKWKKPNEELVVLLPQFGKTGSYDTCKFKVEMKGFAYYTHSGNLNSEPKAMYKDWMVKHNYDPEHGKDAPMQATAASGGTSAAGSQSTGPQTTGAQTAPAETH